MSKLPVEYVLRFLDAFYTKKQKQAQINLLHYLFATLSFLLKAIFRYIILYNTYIYIYIIFPLENQKIDYEKSHECWLNILQI